MTQHARLDWKLCENQQMGVLEVIEEDESEFVGLQKTETCGGSDHSVLLITKRITKLYPVKTGRNSKLNVTNCHTLRLSYQFIIMHQMKFHCVITLSSDHFTILESLSSRRQAYYSHA